MNLFSSIWRATLRRSHKKDLTTETQRHRVSLFRFSAPPRLRGKNNSLALASLRLSASLIVLVVSGCNTIPFDPPEKADYRSVDPVQVIESFDASVAKDFELLESVVFEFFGKNLTGMGYLLAESESTKYALSCMTPAGIKLFEFRGEGTEVEALFIPPPLEKHQEMFTRSVAQDIRRIYFDWTPPESAKLKHKKDRLIYTAKVDGVNVKYIFAGPDQTLAEKHFSGWWRKHCSIYYFNYEKEGGLLYPKAIVLHNRKYHYRLILRVKSVQTISSFVEEKMGDE